MMGESVCVCVWGGVVYKCSYIVCTSMELERGREGGKERERERERESYLKSNIHSESNTVRVEPRSFLIKEACKLV